METKVENSVTTTTTAYEIRSSVLAHQVIAAINGQGAKNLQYVYTSSGTELASGTAETSMVFVHRDPVTGTEQLSWNNGLNSGRTEVDPVGADVGTFQPIEDYPGNDMPLRHGRPSEPFNHCSANGLPNTCSGPDYAFWGSRIADLPGFGTNWGSMVELGLWMYGRRLVYTMGRNGIVTRTREGLPRGTDPTFIAPHQNPQNTGQQSTGVKKPLENIEELERLMTDALNYGECREKVAELIAQLGKNATLNNQPIYNDVMDVLERVKRDGGLRINVPGGARTVPGGSGESQKDPVKLANLTVVWKFRTDIFVALAFKDEPRWTARIPYEYGITGIHEMLHLIGNAYYSEEALDKAARQLGSTGIDNYLRKHCNPPPFDK